MNKNKIIKEGVVLGILILFIGASVFPTTMGDNRQFKPQMKSFATIQVDDDGDGDYTTITEAIANADIDDIIEVYSGTYTENVVVNIRVILQGIDDELGGGGGSGKPILDGSGNGHVVDIQANGVIFTGFEVQNSGLDGNINSGIYSRYYSDIEIGDCDIQNNLNGILLRDDSDANTIYDNTFLNNGKNSIWLKGSDVSIITGNVIKFSGETGIHLWECNGAEVSGNVVSVSDVNAIYLEDTMGSTIQQNSFSNNTKGGRLDASNDNIFKINTFQGNSEHGLYVWDGSSENLFYLNNFVENDVHAYDPSPALDNVWNGLYPTGGNYWDDYTGIDEKKGPNQNEDGADSIGDTPYDIAYLSQDLYPQMYMEDPDPPIVEIATPERGYLYIGGNVIMPILLTTIVVRSINVTADAIDIISGVEYVEFYLDGNLMGNDTEEPYTWMWDTWSLKKRHTLSAIAYDLAGNSNSTELIVWKFL